MSFWVVKIIKNNGNKWGLKRGWGWFEKLEWVIFFFLISSTLKIIIADGSLIFFHRFGLSQKNFNVWKEILLKDLSYKNLDIHTVIFYVDFITAADQV